MNEYFHRMIWFVNRFVFFSSSTFDFWMNIYNEINSICTFEWRILQKLWWNVFIFMNEIRPGMARHREISRHDVKSNHDDFIMGNLCLYTHTSLPFISWLIYLFVNQISHFGWTFVHVSTDVALNYNHFFLLKAHSTTFFSYSYSLSVSLSPSLV